MNIFLKLKHWQLFGLLIGFPVIFQFVAMRVVITNNNLVELLLGFLINPASLFDVFSIVPTKLVAVYSVMMVLFTVLISCWFYALGTNLCKRLPGEIKMNLTVFKLSLAVSVAHKLFISVYMYFLFAGISAGEELNPAVLPYFVPLYLISTFCTFYCFHFIAKALKTVELQKAVTFNGYALEFFGIWICPVGVWFIQPQINRLFNYPLNT